MYPERCHILCCRRHLNHYLFSQIYCCRKTTVYDKQVILYHAIQISALLECIDTISKTLMVLEIALFYCTLNKNALVWMCLVLTLMYPPYPLLLTWLLWRQIYLEMAERKKKKKAIFLSVRFEVPVNVCSSLGLLSSKHFRSEELYLYQATVTDIVTMATAGEKHWHNDRHGGHGNLGISGG